MLNNVLIIGGTGYLGRHLCIQMKQKGYTVYISGRISKPESNYFQIDFENPHSFNILNNRNFDIIIILASKLNAINTNKLNHPDLKTNSIGYGNFLNYIAENKITSKIIYTSSMTVYGNQNKLPVSEEGILEPPNTYGLSKLLAEKITSFFCIQNNLNGVILRLPGIYGGDRKNGFIYSTIKKLENNEIVHLQTKNLGYWETINVDDLCSMICDFISCYKWDNIIDIFNIGYGEETDFYETANLIVEIIGQKQKIIYEKEKDYIPFFLSNEKLKQIIPIKYNFQQSLKNYIHTLK